MKTILRRILLISITLFFLTSSFSYAQKKVYTYGEGEEYFTIELETTKPKTWGTYRTLNHHSIPYFDMTFISEQEQAANGDLIMTLVPTFYGYAYHNKVQGVPDTLNTRVQHIKFHLRIKDEGKTLEFIEPDSLTRAHFNKISSFDKKDEVDITYFPPSFRLNKKPKWKKFSLGLRNSLAARLKDHQRKTIRYDD